MADDDDFWDDLVEDHEHLERVGALRHEAPPFPAELLTSNPTEVRMIIQHMKAEKSQEAIKVPIPPPEIPARPAEEHDPVPRTADRILAKAGMRGWTGHLTYGRGPWLGSRDRAAQSDVVWAWLSSPSGERIRAVWRDGKFVSGRHYSPYRHEEGPNWVAVSSPEINRILEAE